MREIYDSKSVFCPRACACQPDSRLRAHSTPLRHVDVGRRRIAMHLNGFDLNLLVALDALLRERSVTKAAECLHITQPAMSHALNRLRMKFGDPLLERSGRELRLTSLGAELVQPVRGMINAAESLLELSREFDPAVATRTCRIALSDYCSMVLLPHIVSRFAKLAPGIRFEAEPLGDRSYERLCARQIDFLVSAQDIRLVGPDADAVRLNRHDLFVDRFVTGSALDHPVVADGLNRSNYEEYPHVSFRSGLGTRSWEDQAKSSAGVSNQVGAITGTLGSMPLILPNTLLLATFPSRLIEPLDLERKISIHPCPADIPDLVETLYWEPLSDLEASSQWLREQILIAASQI